MSREQLAGARVVLGVTGGIAAYKAVELCRRLVDAGAHVVPVMTDGATRFVGETTFSALASEPVQRSLWDEASPIPHTRMGQDADVIVVAPATARLLSDYASGRSADLLTATLLATRAPVVLCPAMHTEMWEHGAVQENLRVLRSRGVMIADPESGRLAGGDLGHGRLADVGRMVDAVAGALSAPDLEGLTVLVTAGGTREPIDPVRYLGNRSSGKQGHALAAAAHRRGAGVVLVTTRPDLAPPGLDTRPVETAAEMAESVATAAPGCDVVVMAAAVADFTPVVQAPEKLKKADGTPEIRLEPTVDILAGLGQAKAPGQTLVGFAAETTDVARHAPAKLVAKGADLLVANDVSAPGVGFGYDTNAVTIYSSVAPPVEVALGSKAAVADAVFDAVVAHRIGSAGPETGPT